MKTILYLIVVMAIAVSVKACKEDSDCAKNECCAGTPGATSVCIKFLEKGEQCSFRFRTPVFMNEY
jgi:hypothetical protein